MPRPPRFGGKAGFQRPRQPGRRSMARKLKSDKCLFLATLLLVPASAWSWSTAPQPRWRWSACSSPTLFLIKQAHVGARSAWSLPGDRHARRLPHVRSAALIWSAAAALVALLLVARAVHARRSTARAAGSASAASACSRQSSPSCAAILFTRGAARAAHAPHRRACATRCCRSDSSSAAMTALILLEPDFGTAVVDCSLVVGADGVRGRAELSLSSSARRCSQPPASRRF